MNWMLTNFTNGRFQIRINNYSLNEVRIFHYQSYCGRKEETDKKSDFLEILNTLYQLIVFLRM